MPAAFTIVVRCADPRLEAFFVSPVIRRALGLTEERQDLAEAHIANVGGLLSLAGAEVPRLVHDVALLSRLFGKEGDVAVVLTAHSSCGGYLDSVEGEEERAVARQIDDLRTTAHRLREALPQVSVSAHWLDLATGEVRPVEL